MAKKIVPQEKNITDEFGHINISREQYKSTYKQKKSRLKPVVFWPLFIFFFSLISFNCYKLFTWDKDNKKIEKLGEELVKIANPTPEEDEGELINPPESKESDYWYYIKFPFYNVDFTELLKKNADTVAFINVPNTNINYPIVQTKDNNYYLSHAFDKSRNDAGWVFMDYRNKSDFSDSNSIIYGHGRLNKTVFGSLRNTLTPEWQNNKDNYVINVSTLKANYVYQIFSIYTIEQEAYYLTNNFQTKKKKEEWLKTMKSRSFIKLDVDLSSDDKIITLSTCENNYGNRIVVHGKLIKSKKK